MSNKNNIDEIFNSAAKQYSAPAPSRSWSNIEGALKNQRRITLTKNISIAASVIITAIVSTYAIFNFSNSDVNEIYNIKQNTEIATLSSSESENLTSDNGVKNTESSLNKDASIQSKDTKAVVINDDYKVVANGANSNDSESDISNNISNRNDELKNKEISIANTNKSDVGISNSSSEIAIYNNKSEEQGNNKTVNNQGGIAQNSVAEEVKQEGAVLENNRLPESKIIVEEETIAENINPELESNINQESVTESQKNQVIFGEKSKENSIVENEVLKQEVLENEEAAKNNTSVENNSIVENSNTVEENVTSEDVAESVVIEDNVKESEANESINSDFNTNKKSINFFIGSTIGSSFTNTVSCTTESPNTKMAIAGTPNTNVGFIGSVDFGLNYGNWRLSTGLKRYDHKVTGDFTVINFDPYNIDAENYGYTDLGIIRLFYVNTNVRIANPSSALYVQDFDKYNMRIRFIDIPLNIAYNFKVNNWSFIPKVGINNTLILSNEVKLEKENQTFMYGEVKDVKKFNIGLSTGGGVSYNFLKHWNVGIDLDFIYYPFSMSNNPNYCYKPYSLLIGPRLEFSF